MLPEFLEVFGWGFRILELNNCLIFQTLFRFESSAIFGQMGSAIGLKPSIYPLTRFVLRKLEFNFYKKPTGLSYVSSVWVACFGNSYLEANKCLTLPTYIWFFEWFSIECPKTKSKTKVITLANHKRHRQYSEIIKTRSNYVCSWREVPENVCERVRVVMEF